MPATVQSALLALCPGAHPTCNDLTYEGVIWHDPQKRPMPSREEVEAKIADLAKLEYQDKRRAEYPPIGDQLDALWKGGADMAAMKAQIDAIKAKYSKPA